MNTIAIIAAKEFRDGVRSRWLLMLSLLLAALSMLICHFGGIGSASDLVLPIPQMMLSLSTLMAVMIPLIAILLSFDAIVGEQEQGTLSLLLSYPLARSQLLLGKFVGLGAIIAATLLFTFVCCGLSLLPVLETTGQMWLGLAQLGFNSLLIGLVFLSLALWVSTLVSTKARALACLFGVWCALVLLWDLALLALLVADVGMASLVKQMLLFNPVDLFRLTAVLAQQPELLTGVMSLLSGTGYHWIYCSGGLLLWLSVLLLGAVKQLERK